MQGNRPIVAINIVALLILCVFAVGFGFHGGASQATASTQATPSQTPSMAALSQPLEKQTSAADSLRAANTDLVERLQRELSSEQSQIDDLREQPAKAQGDADKNAQKASEPSSESLASQFDRFAGRFVAAVDSTVQNSTPNPGERKGTRTLKVSLISDELTSTGDDQPARGVVSLKQSEDFQSDDGASTWSREWVFRYSFVMKDGRWHCLGGTARMDRDDNSSRAGKSPFIGKVLPVAGDSWDDSDIQ
jgi:hypothetical protein